MKSLAIFSVGLLLLTTTTVAMASDVGRFQALPLPKAKDDFSDRIIILDTTTGELWQWWEAPAFGNSPARTGITYMGKVSPGNAPGETHTFDRFVLPKPAN